jgi:hypothetical protein
VWIGKRGGFVMWIRSTGLQDSGYLLIMLWWDSGGLAIASKGAFGRPHEYIVPFHPSSENMMFNSPQLHRVCV